MYGSDIVMLQGIPVSAKRMKEGTSSPRRSRLAAPKRVASAMEEAPIIRLRPNLLTKRGTTAENESMRAAASA